MRDAYTGEAQFLAWGDGPAGPWVKLLLPDSEALGPFRGMTAAKKAMAGQLLAVKIVEVEVTDGTESAPPAGGKGSGSRDQAPASTPAPAKAGKAPQRLSNYAALLCRTPAFHRFMAARNPDLWRQALRICDEDPEKAAAHEIRLWCDVATRADLDVPANTSAIESFHVLREEYANWLKERVE